MITSLHTLAFASNVTQPLIVNTRGGNKVLAGISKYFPILSFMKFKLQGEQSQISIMLKILPFVHANIQTSARQCRKRRTCLNWSGHFAINAESWGSPTWILHAKEYKLRINSKPFKHLFANSIKKPFTALWKFVHAVNKFSLRMLLSNISQFWISHWGEHTFSFSFFNLTVQCGKQGPLSL